MTWNFSRSCVGSPHKMKSLSFFCLVIFRSEIRFDKRREESCDRKFVSCVDSQLHQVCDYFLLGKSDKYSYQTSLLHAPDLPAWIHYTYSKADHQGYLYGVAPRNQTDFKVSLKLFAFTITFWIEVCLFYFLL